MEWGKKWGVMLLVGVVGVGLLMYGAWEQIKPGEVRVEVVHSDTVTQCHGEECGRVVVDVAGAVEKPAVYHLQVNSRIGDALVVAGGLSAQADREWVAKNLNLAKEVRDGEKVYVPSLLNKVSPSQIQSKGETLEGTVNINMASEGELDKLEGIGEARARVIIENRPYGSTEELVTKAKIPQSVYEKIKSSVSVY